VWGLRVGRSEGGMVTEGGRLGAVKDRERACRDRHT
jgi:hypothetical protein